MVSNQIKRAYSLRPFFLLLFSLICGVSNAQKISKYYTSSLQDNGILYFIEPKQEFSNSKEDCKIIYDLTYLTANDSISLNFTYSDKIFREIDSIALVQGKINLSSKVNKIFIETDKNIWKHRYSAKYRFNDFYKIFKSKELMYILIYSSNKTIKLDIKKKRWKKKSSIILKILNLIKANRKKSP